MSGFEDRAEREADRFGDRPVRTGIRWGVAVGIVVLVLAVVFAVGHFAFSWFDATTQVFGPTNVKAQELGVIEDWQAMERQAEIVCEIEETKGGRSGPTFLEDPAQANAAVYRRTQIDYNRRQQSFFEAKEVGPGGYPSEAPTLAGMKQKVCSA
jgi:hypothetical protein